MGEIIIRVDHTICRAWANRWRPKPWVVVLSITVFGAGLRLYHLGYKSLWLDEARIYWISQGDFRHIILKNATQNSAPPTFPVIVNLMSKIGDSEALLRLFSCLVGIAAIPSIYYFSRRLVSRNAAYFSAFIVALVPSQVMYSQELREYSFTFLLTCFILHTFYSYLQKPNWRHLFLFTCVGVICVFVQYGLALLILSLNLIIVIELFFVLPRKPFLTKWILGQLFILAAVIVVYHISIMHQLKPGGLDHHSYLSQACWDGTCRGFFSLALYNTYNIFVFAYPIKLLDRPDTVLFLFLCVLGVGECFRRGMEGRRILLMFFMPFLVTFLFACAGLYPYHGHRQVIFLTVMIYLMAAVGLDRLSKWDRQKTGVLILIFVLTVNGLLCTFHYLSRVGGENIRPLMTRLSSSRSPDDMVYVYCGSRDAFGYYNRKHTHSWVAGVNPRKNQKKHDLQMEQLISHQGQAWMIFTHCIRDDRKKILQRIATQRRVDLVTSDSGAWLYRIH